MKKKRAVFLVLAVLGVLLLPAVVLGAEEEPEADDLGVGVIKKGFVYNIAEDRKVEKIAGVYEPEGLDKYMKRLFEALNRRLDQMESKLDGLGEQVAALQENFEKETKKKSGLIS